MKEIQFEYMGHLADATGHERTRHRQGSGP